MKRGLSSLVKIYTLAVREHSTLISGEGGDSYISIVKVKAVELHVLWPRGA